MSLSCTQFGGCSGRLNPSSHPCTGAKPLHLPKAQPPEMHYGWDQRSEGMENRPWTANPPHPQHSVSFMPTETQQIFIVFNHFKLKPFLKNVSSNFRLWISHVPWAGVLQEDVVAHMKPQGHISRWSFDQVQHNRCVMDISVHSLYTGISLSIQSIFITSGTLFVPNTNLWIGSSASSAINFQFWKGFQTNNLSVHNVKVQ